MKQRRLLVAAIATLVIVVAATALATLATRHFAAPDTPEPGWPRPMTGGPKPPERGAYLGAWVQPWTGQSAQHRVQAMRAYERMLGRRMDIAHFYRQWEDEFPALEEREAIAEGRIPMISWAGTASADVAAGKADAVLRDRARRVRDLKVPVFMRWRWEMDRDDLEDSAGPPEAYVTAWKRARRIFAEQGATNASWVWCPTAWGFGKDRAAAFYPGDAQVDWLCVDAYAGEEMRPLEKVIGPFMRWAKDHPGKPIMIGEYGAYGDDEARARWLREAGAMAKRRVRIKAMVYFDSDFYDDEGKHAPYTLRNSPKSLAAFRGLLTDPYFNPRRLPIQRPEGTVQGRS